MNRYNAVKVVDCGGKTGHKTSFVCKVGEIFGASKDINKAHEMIENYANEAPVCDCKFEVREISQ